MIGLYFHFMLYASWKASQGSSNMVNPVERKRVHIPINIHKCLWIYDRTSDKKSEIIMELSFDLQSSLSSLLKLIL